MFHLASPLIAVAHPFKVINAADHHSSENLSMCDIAKGKITVALDWTPNTNHVGMYVALQEGFYTAAGLNVTLVPPNENEGAVTPPRRVAAGTATFAVGASETVVSFATTSTQQMSRLVAVAALLQGSTSAICTLQSSGIDTPAKLQGRRFASHWGRFSDAMVRTMVNNAGGDGSKVIFQPLPGHGYAVPEIFEAGSVVASFLERGLSDSAWIFSHWEGLLAARAGQKLNEFSWDDYNVAYGYAPILFCRPDTISDHMDKVKAFLAATERGYKIAASDPVRGAKALCACGHPSLKDKEFVMASAQAIAPAILSKTGSWGTMTMERWRAFVDFLTDNKIIVDHDGVEYDRSKIIVSELFTNDALPCDLRGLVIKKNIVDK
ncbi:hypothetical protein FisN_27Hu127 [Fistulifera solaris]|uniref:Thiamine pyrimidine synthase n=1 Tax=Fistulifera solaris TaxID=1519565 RepID=A0A1Z5KQ32_FISSO|nr:hypothetical protein FisN_27Hu127 [Fistulifera solaris]|eukprot:GAX28225.1 hypothetical protein FisN_27Hu127 [Fistulifera solaris]